MKRIKIAGIILAAVIIAAAGIFLIAKYYNDKTAEESEAEAQKLIMFDFNADDVEKVEIHTDGEDFIIDYVSDANQSLTSNTHGGWNLTNNNEFYLNDAIISAICTNMSNLKASKILDSTDTSAYGFDNPVKITVSTKDKSSYTVLIGDSTATYENFYAMKENDDNIYLIDFTIGSILCPSKDALKYTYIYPYSSYDITHFALWKGKESDNNILFSMNKDSNSDWAMEKPFNDNTVYLSQINDFLTQTSKDEIYSFVQENCTEADYSKYGFDNPQYVFEISTAEDKIKVIFGDYTNNDTEFYGLFTETGQVVTFATNTITIFNYKTADMLNSPIFSTDISRVTEAEVTISDKKVVLGIDTDSESYKLNGKIVSDDKKDLYISFFNAFNNAYYIYEENSSVPSGNEEIKVKYTLSSNTVTEISYIPIPETDNYWVLKDGDYTGYTIKKNIISNISSSYEELAKAMNIS